MRRRSLHRRARQLSRRRLSRSLSRSTDSLPHRRLFPRQNRPRRTIKSLPALKKPPSRSKHPDALAYLEEAAFSEAASATVTKKADILSTPPFGRNKFR